MPMKPRPIMPSIPGSGTVVPPEVEEVVLPPDVLPPEVEEVVLPPDVLPPEVEEVVLPPDVLPPEVEEVVLPPDVLPPEVEEVVLPPEVLPPEVEDVLPPEVVPPDVEDVLPPPLELDVDEDVDDVDEDELAPLQPGPWWGAIGGAGFHGWIIGALGGTIGMGSLGSDGTGNTPVMQQAIAAEAENPPMITVVADAMRFMFVPSLNWLCKTGVFVWLTHD
jgi:hypothetical protein